MSTSFTYFFKYFYLDNVLLIIKLLNYNSNANISNWKRSINFTPKKYKFFKFYISVTNFYLNFFLLFLFLEMKKI